MKYRLMRLCAVLCAFFVCFSISVVPVSAGDNPWASAFSHTLNNSIYQNKVLGTENPSDYITVDCDTGEYPQGIIYADLMTFDNQTDPYMLIVRADSVRGAVSVEVYNYNPQNDTAELMTVISKGYNIDSGIVRELAWGHNAERRYIVFSDYRDGGLISRECYTVFDGVMYRSVTEPKEVMLSGVVSFGRAYLHPETDVSYYNESLGMFFESMKNDVANEVEFENISDTTDRGEVDNLKLVLNKTAGFDTFDISDYDTMAEYSLAVKQHDGEAELNAITHIYDLGEELYYVRYSTDECYHNGAILRRTDAVIGGYQILMVNNDFIPFSQRELESITEKCLTNKLLLEKADSEIGAKDKPFFDIEKKIDVPKVISSDLKLPIALIGGGVILGLFVVLSVIMRKNDDE